MSAQVPGTPRSAEVEAELRRRFAMQRNLTSSDAEMIARRIAAADDVVWNVAERWVESGRFPDSPAIQGHTPASLEQFGRGGSFVLTALMGLRRDPSAAAITLAHLTPLDPDRV